MHSFNEPYEPKVSKRVLMKDHSNYALISKTQHLKKKKVDYLIYPIGQITACYKCAVDQCLFLTVYIVLLIKTGFLVTQLYYCLH